MIIYNRTNYKELTLKGYRKEKRRLQIELLKLQEWVNKTGGKLAIVLEGRDAAGKGATIKRFIENLIPKTMRVVELGVPTPHQNKMWFQTYNNLLPKQGEIVFFDRSWYTRALTEPTLCYCSKKHYEDFMTNVNKWEDKLISNGIEVVKFYFSIDKDQQQRRLSARKNSRLKYWKLSASDKLMVNKWDVFTLYKNQMFDLTARSNSPWIIINANNKMIARLTALRFILNQVPYENKKLLKPLAWTKKINNYKATLEGIEFDNLSFEQYKILTKYSDD